MSKSYFPADRTGRIDWYNNFGKEFSKVGKDLGFSDAEITNAADRAMIVLLVGIQAPCYTRLPIRGRRAASVMG